MLIGDYIRISLGLDKYKPIDTEIERYVEEVELYESEVTNLQYSPKPDEVRIAAKNIPVEVTGEPTDKIEVSHRDLERVETNNITGWCFTCYCGRGYTKSAKGIEIRQKIEN